MRDYFYTLADTAMKLIADTEFATLNFSGEQSDFVRLNNNRVRQAGNVRQMTVHLDLIDGRKHAAISAELCGDQTLDTQRLKDMINTTRKQRQVLPDDPFLNFATEKNDSDYDSQNTLPDTDDSLNVIFKEAAGLDLVGIWANGQLYRGFANSAGQRNWYHNANFNFDWSVYHSSDKAVKMGYAGFDWDSSLLASKMSSVREALAIMGKQPVSLTPGKYRVYLAPAALYEFLSMVIWQGFSLEDVKTAQTPLLQMVTDGRKVDSSIQLTDNRVDGFASAFSAEGFILPDSVKLIDSGCYHSSLASARSAKEYGEPVNADYEYPSSLDLAAGDIDVENILKTLDTGIFISNLWYCNFSDHEACRITGMTRYACFWVEKGKIVAPINVMRFDETFYNLLGKNLFGLTSQREVILDPDSYHQRSTSSARLPGLLANDFQLTL